MKRNFTRNVSPIAIIYLVITIILFSISIVCSSAGFTALKEFFLALIENFNIHMAMENLIKTNLDEGFELSIFMLSILQVTYISRIVSKFLEDEKFLDKIIMFFANVCLSCFLSISYALYPMRFLESIIGSSPLFILITVGFVYSFGKSIHVIRDYTLGAYMFVGQFLIWFFINPIALGAICVIIPMFFGIQVYAWLYDAILYKNIILLFLTVLIISYPINVIVGKTTDFLLDRINGEGIPVTDLFYGFFSIALIVAWLVFILFKTEYTDLTFTIENEQYTYKAIETIDRGIEQGEIWWGYFKDGTLIIDGQYGKMLDYSFDNSPWYIYRDKIEKVVVLDETTNIGADAFYGLDNVKQVYISSDVKSIGARAFDNCNKLNAIYVDQNNEFYSTEDGVLYDKEKKVLLKCPEGKKMIEVPETVEKIEDKFVNNVILEEINVNSNNQIFSSQEGVLYNKDKTKLLRCPIGKRKCIVEDNTKEIESEAAEYCHNLESVILPENLKSIGYASFSGCRKLKKIEIPESVEIIESTAFMDCEDLKEVVLKSDSTKIEKDVFLRSNPVIERETYEYK